MHRRGARARESVKKLKISRRDAEARRLNRCFIFSSPSPPLRLCAICFRSFRDSFTANHELSLPTGMKIGVSASRTTLTLGFSESYHASDGRICFRESLERAGCPRSFSDSERGRASTKQVLSGLGLPCPGPSTVRPGDDYQHHSFVASSAPPRRQHHPGAQSAGVGARARVGRMPALPLCVAHLRRNFPPAGRCRNNST